MLAAPVPAIDGDGATVEAVAQAVLKTFASPSAASSLVLRARLLQVGAGEPDAEPPLPCLLYSQLHERANTAEACKNGASSRALPYDLAMSNAKTLADIDDDAAEAEALAQAIAESDADPREVPHSEVRAWLLRVAAGEFDAEPPTPRIL